jgi:hypothetical protein
LLSPSDYELLKKNPVYLQKYKGKTYSELTLAGILTDLDAIQSVSVENLPLIEFLSRLYNAKNQEDSYTALNNIDGYIEYNREYPRYEWGLKGSGDGPENANLDVEITSHTLAGGALANAVIAAAVASFQLQLLWTILYWDTAPAAAYVYNLQEEDQANQYLLQYQIADNGKLKRHYFKTANDNKAILGDITGGAGGEILYMIAGVVRFT